MIIAVQRGLAAIKENLEAHGYKTVYADEYSHQPDAFIYTGNRQFGFTPLYNGIQDVSSSSISCIDNSGRNSAVIEINASEKSLSDIEAALNRRRPQTNGYFY